MVLEFQIRFCRTSLSHFSRPKELARERDWGWIPLPASCETSRADSGKFKAGRNALSDLASAGGVALQLVFGLGRCIFNFRVAKAGHQMIIHHPDCLHERVANRRPNKLESSFE